MLTSEPGDQCASHVSGNAIRRMRPSCDEGGRGLVPGVRPWALRVGIDEAQSDDFGCRPRCAECRIGTETEKGTPEELDFMGRRFVARAEFQYEVGARNAERNRLPHSAVRSGPRGVLLVKARPIRRDRGVWTVHGCAPRVE